MYVSNRQAAQVKCCIVLVFDLLFAFFFPLSLSFTLLLARLLSSLFCLMLLVFKCGRAIDKCLVMYLLPRNEMNCQLVVLLLLRLLLLIHINVWNAVLKWQRLSLTVANYYLLKWYWAHTLHTQCSSNSNEMCCHHWRRRCRWRRALSQAMKKNKKEKTTDLMWLHVYDGLLCMLARCK